MNPEFINSKEPQEIKRMQRVRHLVNSQEKAITLVQQFWKNMPHGKEVLSSMKNDNNWGQELTAGDRTSIKQGILPKEKGSWVHYFSR